MNLGKNISILREEKNMSQSELAEKLFVSRELVSKWELGSRRPDYEMIENIASVLGVSPDSIVDKNDLVFSELSECIPEGFDVSKEKLGEAIDSVLKEIRHLDADVFIERYYLLMNTSQIARNCGIGENRIRSILSKTRAKIRNRIKDVMK